MTKEMLRLGAVCALALSLTTGCGSDGSSDAEPASTGGTPAPAETTAENTTEQPAAPPSIMCDGAAQHTAPASDFAPASRVNSLVLPKTVADATAAGCISKGANAGTGLAGLLTFIGDLNEFVTEKDGDYELILLAHMPDWAAGTDPSSHKLNIYIGSYVDGSFLVDLDSYNNAMKAEGPKLQFDATVNECAVTTAEGNFELPISISDGLDINLALTGTTVRGKLAGDAVGFSLSEATISGYLSADAIRDIVIGLQAACRGEDQNENGELDEGEDANGNGMLDPSDVSLCTGAAASIINGDVDKVVGTLLTLIKKYDTKITNGVVSECDTKVEGDCNAVSVCLAIGSEPVVIKGDAED
ncbi:MAG: hypothetical protein VX589_17750 [Myxococcota bacterium]|nr:hypothetical protein [Myxococcota bacterium]